MTVHQPRSRIISGESKGKPASSWQDSHVSSSWILPRQGRWRVLAIEYALPATEDVKVVPVEMNWMGNRDTSCGWLLYDPVRPLSDVSYFFHPHMQIHTMPSLGISIRLNADG